MDIHSKEEIKEKLLQQRLKRKKLQRIIISLVSTASALAVLFLVFALGNFNNNTAKVANPASESSILAENSVTPKPSVTPELTKSPEASPSPTPAATATPSPTPTPAPAEKPETTIRLCMIGDVLLHDAIIQTSKTEYGYDFSPLFSNISDRLAGYDLKIVNQETACGGESYGITGYPSFNGPTECIDAMANTGFNLVCLATNHMLDNGISPMLSTLDYWNTNYPGVGTIGAYSSAESAENIYVYQKEDFKVAVLNYTYGTNAGSGDLLSAPYCLNFLNEEKVYSDIQRAKEISDFVIVIPHWGTEHNLGTDASQDYWATQFNEWGVDLVIGSHPHVIEPIEAKTSSTGHTTVIFYSLGNFVSNPANANLMVGAMADVTLTKDENGVRIDDFGAIPLITHQQGYFTTYFWSEYSPEMYYESVGHIQDPTFTYEYCTDLIYSVFGDRVRP
jgi:poly-gamma-glutamate capsule biosynthesis protein CapA/YwtB (metallophosphatase superfamily)